MDILFPLYILSFISSVISAFLALYAIRFSKRTEYRLKNNFKSLQSMLIMQNKKTEDLLESMTNEAEDIRGSVHITRLELLDSIEKVHEIREDLLQSIQSLEDNCIINKSN